MSDSILKSALDASLDWTEGHEAILYETCANCGGRTYFRREFCPSCGTSPVEVRTSGCDGVVYAVTTVVRAPSPEWRALAPYALLLVDLTEGPRVMTHGSEGLAIGNRVHIGFKRLGDRLIPYAAAI